MSEQTGLDRSRLQERRFADLIGAELHAGSGNQWRRKNDMHNSNLLVECKRTDAEKSIGFKVEDFTDVRHNAVTTGKLPILHIEVGRHDIKRYVILSEDDFLAMAEGCGYIDVP